MRKLGIQRNGGRTVLSLATMAQRESRVRKRFGAVDLPISRSLRPRIRRSVPQNFALEQSIVSVSPSGERNCVHDNINDFVAKML